VLQQTDNSSFPAGFPLAQSPALEMRQHMVQSGMFRHQQLSGLLAHLPG